MAELPKFTMQELLDAGAHFGHKTMRWDPRMAPYIYGERNGVHIINLQKTVPLLHRALEVAQQVAAGNGRVLFVSTKRQAAGLVREAAERCGQYYVNHRWLGGMLTNWGTVSKSIKTLNTLREQLDNPELVLVKKERLQIQRKVEKLEKALGGIKDMGGLPSLLFVVDTKKEKIAIDEARKLGIPVIGVVDTNANPENIDYIIPANDDSIRSIRLLCDLMSEAVIGGLKSSLADRPEATEHKGAKMRKDTKKIAVTTGGKAKAVEVEAKSRKKLDKKDAAPEAETQEATAAEPAAEEPPLKAASGS